MNRHETQDQRQAISPQFRTVEAPHNESIPDESRIGSLKDSTLPEISGRLLRPLHRVRQVIGVRKVKIRRVQKVLDHVQVDFILCFLRLGQMRQRHVRDEVKSGQSPNNLTPDDAHKDAMRRDHQIVAAYDANYAQNAAHFSYISHVWNDLGRRLQHKADAGRDPIDNYEFSLPVWLDVEPFRRCVAETEIALRHGGQSSRFALY